MKQPVYIRSDFVNCCVELTNDQVKRLVVIANEMAAEVDQSEDYDEEDDL